MSRITRRTGIAFTTILLLVPLAASHAADAQPLWNTNVSVDFNLKTGTYSVAMAARNAPAIRNAYATVEGWSSTDAGYRRRIAKQTDERLVVECARPDAPTLLLEFTLHPAFVELRTGLKNTTAKPVRIKTMRPLTGGIVFPGENWTDVRTLDAPSGANQPRVATSAVRSSANNLLLTFKQSGIRRSLVLGALKTADFTKWAHFLAGSKAGVEAYDPIGKLVDPGETYLPADSFYVDAGTANPFEALEKYGRALRQATGATRLNPYDFPTVCAWYTGVWQFPGAQNHPEKSKYQINTSTGMVSEAEAIRKSGFLNYSRAAVRLVPDSYTEYNPQGWWDNAHWQKHGYYTAPYETSAKLGRAMHATGCLAFTYIQPYIQPPPYKHVMSRDFREAHRDWIHNKDLTSFYNLDYSLPAVQEYIQSRFGALRANIDGLMVDYADELWQSLLYGRSPDRRLAVTTYENISAGDKPAPPALADPKMTATAFYRMFFRCVKDGLGPDSWLHERNIEQPNNDLTLGIVDSQRTSPDDKSVSPDLISRSTLRWYKNRVVLAYDMDGKDLTGAWKIKGWNSSDADGRRMMLTMAYVAASRLLLANSFRDIPPEAISDLARTFPYPTEPRSARPVDAFTHQGWPRVYDFAVTPDWHQVTLFNNTRPTRAETIAVPLAGDPADGALGLDPHQEYYAYDFWNDRFVGKLKGTDTLQQTLRPGEARMLSIRKVERHPQVLSTNRHIMQGYLDLLGVTWRNHRLVGKAKVVAGEPYKIIIALNGRQPEDLKPSADGRLTVLPLESPRTETVEWSVNFK